MIALRDFILKYYCKERSRVYLGSAYLHLISFPSKKDFGFLNPKPFRTKDTRRGKYQNSTVEFECTTKKEQNAHKNKKKEVRRAL